MKNKKVKDYIYDVSRIKMAEVRYFDTKRCAAEIPVNKAYVILINVNGTYINMLNPGEELPVFSRTKYPNVSKDGFEFGTRICLENGELQDGLCFILEHDDMYTQFHEELVSMSEVEDYVLNSDKFYIDRIKLLQKGKKPRNISIKKKMKEDLDSLDKFNEFLGTCEKGLQYKK